MNELVEKLKKENKTISTMESCSGGALANAITNVEGASEVFSFSAITYSNEFKIKMGVNKDIIEKYTVYSMETAKEMSKQITNFTNSNYGVGVTGKINRYDPANLTGDNQTVYLSLYDKDNNKYYTKTIKVLNQERVFNKELIKEEFVKLFKENIKIK